jgi:glutaredoxin
VTARVTLYSKPGCHLCDDARAVIERVCAEVGESYDEVSILDDPALLERYAEEIPVTLVDGKQHDFWRVDEARLRAALAARPPLYLTVTNTGLRPERHASVRNSQLQVTAGGRRAWEWPRSPVLFSRSHTPRVEWPLQRAAPLGPRSAAGEKVW